ncbi:MAG: amino acid ABC transporter substrate-binding protein [Rhodospirillaceae bacterium]|jgi:branched-chain amino acid transport system substrate-binding protein|nr:amino acid ABC transporter substrate-binding protein [Rhodospirillaceae bacterium]MBT5938703.1 amino acid ABC transporter substrate-binding protein [Rhodospirillaceae bacterium]MBT7956742.1 amino acid ABC transporter substrate-binding protein [Rhodospirillaceae bacterium]
MNKFSFHKPLITGVAIAAMAVSISAVSAETIKIGASAPKTGPLAGGSTVSYWPNVKLWVEQVNARGGIKLKSGKAKIELIEYDDRTNPGEAIKNIQRLATQDKVDFILAPYGTGFNLATAPIFAKFNYPLITHTAITDKIDVLTKRYPNIFFTLGSTTAFSVSVVNILKKMRADGKIGSRVAMVNVADAFGIEMANAARPVFKKEGFEIVYDKSYPLGSPDLSPVIRGAKASKPDAFVAWSYPPDTFGLTAQAKVQGLNVKAYYTAVATAFPAFGGKFGKAAEGILGAGGINPDEAAMKKYFAAHRKVTGKTPDYWASGMVYATFQILEKAIEGVGTKDRKAVINYIKNNAFKTVMGPIKFKNQNNEKFWTVGQWQGGKFYGVSSTGRPGAKSINAKPKW